MVKIFRLRHGKGASSVLKEVIFPRLPKQKIRFLVVVFRTFIVSSSRIKKVLVNKSLAFKIMSEHFSGGVLLHKMIDGSKKIFTIKLLFCGFSNEFSKQKN